MRLSDEAVKEFQTIAREECGVELSDTEARIAAERFFRLGQLIYRPLPEELTMQRPAADPFAPERPSQAAS